MSETKGHFARQYFSDVINRGVSGKIKEKAYVFLYYGS